MKCGCGNDCVSIADPKVKVSPPDPKMHASTERFWNDVEHNREWRKHQAKASEK